MGTPYTVRAGDTLSKIAQAHGYASWEEIYNHADNEDFRARRPNPNVIQPGDTLILPDRAAAAPPTAPPTTPPPATEAPPPDSGATTGSASRQTLSSTTQTVLNSQYELREIVVAQGVQFTNADFQRAVDWYNAQPGSTPSHREYDELNIMPNGLKGDFPTMTVSGSGEAEYVSDTQRIIFKIRVVNTKDAFKLALETAGLHVIYGGHARYGRGPCFGPSDGPGDDWEQGTDPVTRGILRMGYPIIGIPIEEILGRPGHADHPAHRYHFLPVVAGAQKPSSEDCHPEIPRGALRKVALSSELTDLILPQGHPPAEKYWGFGSGHNASILLHAGWTGTHSSPHDLGATNLQCRCFCHFGCSTYPHNWRIIRERKNWRRRERDATNEEQGLAYFHTAAAYAITVRLWLKALFSYPRENAFQPWYPSVEWTKTRTNQLLVSTLPRYGLRADFRVI